MRPWRLRRQSGFGPLSQTYYSPGHKLLYVAYAVFQGPKISPLFESAGALALVSPDGGDGSDKFSVLSCPVSPRRGEDTRGEQTIGIVNVARGTERFIADYNGQAMP